MSPGITEEVSKVAATTVEALKQTPMTLALVIFNVLFMSMMLYLSLKSGARWDAETERLHELVAKVMASCGPAR
jgi:hypothetical protein